MIETKYKVTKVNVKYLKNFIIIQELLSVAFMCQKPLFNPSSLMLQDVLGNVPASREDNYYFPVVHSIFLVDTPSIDSLFGNPFLLLINGV